jgi:hypothetical protein
MNMLKYLPILFVLGCARWSPTPHVPLINGKTPAVEILKAIQSDEYVGKKSARVGDFHIQAALLPPSYMAIAELGADADPTTLQEAEHSYSDLVYFRILFSSDSATSELLKWQLQHPSEYEERVKYYSFGIEHDLKMVTATGDTLPCALSHFERTFNVRPELSILCGFDAAAANAAGGFTLLVNERIFNTGMTKLYYSPEQVQSVLPVSKK